MQARLKLRPGQNGTKKLLARYGERLVCVRYRYDEARRQRLTTVKLIVAQGPWARAHAIRRVRRRRWSTCASPTTTPPRAPS